MTEIEPITKSGLPVFDEPDLESNLTAYTEAMSAESKVYIFKGAIAWNAHNRYGEGTFKTIAEKTGEHEKTVTNYAWVYGRLRGLDPDDQAEIADMLQGSHMQYSHIRRLCGLKDNAEFMELCRKVHDEHKTVKWIVEELAIRRGQRNLSVQAPEDHSAYNPIPDGIVATVESLGQDADDEDFEGYGATTSTGTISLTGPVSAAVIPMMAREVQDACAYFTEDGFRAAVDGMGEDTRRGLRVSLGSARASIDAALMYLYGSNVDVVTGEVIDDEN